MVVPFSDWACVFLPGIKSIGNQSAKPCCVFLFLQGGVLCVSIGKPSAVRTYCIVLRCGLFFCTGSSVGSGTCTCVIVSCTWIQTSIYACKV